MVATFVVERANKKTVRIQTIGLFNDALNPVVFCCRYDWQREISLVEVGDTVYIDGKAYRVAKFDIDALNAVSFELEEIGE